MISSRDTDCLRLRSARIEIADVDAAVVDRACCGTYVVYIFAGLVPQMLPQVMNNSLPRVRREITWEPHRT